MPTFIEKRGGYFEAWNPSKIQEAIRKALIYSGTEDKSHELTDLVLKNINGAKSITVEEVQDIVETVLIKAGEAVAAKNYILYREKRREVREVTSAVVDVQKVIEEYVGDVDWRVKENSNIGKSYQGLTLGINSAVQSKYWLNKLPEEIRSAHTEGFMHIHDLGMLCGYCSGWSLYDLILEGFNAPNQCSSGPAKHFDTLLSQAINFIGTLQNEWSGAQAFSSFDTLTAPFIYYDRLKLEEKLGHSVTDEFYYDNVKQDMQRFIFNLNTTSRWGGQCVTEDTECLTPEGWKKYNELKVGDTIKVFNMETQTIQTDVLQRVLIKEYDGDMVFFELMNNTEILVTPDHRMVLSKNGNLKLEILKASEMTEFLDDFYVPVIESDNEISLDGIRIHSTHPYTGIVWCPTTDTGTFVARRNGKVFITGNCPFSNLTFDLVCPKHYADMPAIIGGKAVDKTYKEFDKEREMVNRAFLEIMLDGDSSGAIHSFPIPTYNVTKDFPWETTVGNLLLQMAAKYGTPYFQNFINSDLNPEDIRSMCPLEENTLVRVRINNEIKDVAIKDTPEECEVYHYGKWYNAKKNMQQGNTIKVTCNSFTVEMGLNHLQPVHENCGFTVKKAKELKILDLLPVDILVKDNDESVFNAIDFEPITKLEYVDEIKTLYCFEVDNDANLFTISSGLITHNCRLSLNKKDVVEHLKNKGNGLFGAGELTGSIGVVTLNLSKMAYLAAKREDKKKAFFDLISRVSELAKTSLELKRKMLNNNMDRGMYPWSNRYLKNKFDSHFSTIGVIAGHEACLNLLGVGIETQEGKQLMIDILNFLRNKITEFQKETGNLYNLEATPGEGTSYRLAKIDKSKYPDIITSGEEVPFYTNSTNLPVDFSTNPIEAMLHQNDLQPLYTGGVVFHTFLGESVPDIKALQSFIVSVMSKTKLPYVSITPTFSVCPDHGYITGEHFNCPKCGKESEVFSRIVGYYRPVSRWGIGKQEEFKVRTEYTMN